MSYNVLDKLRKQVAIEVEQLNHLLEMHRPLLDKTVSNRPDPVELSALAAMLHAFYTGIENLLKRISIEVDGEPPRGESWHRQLLDKMTLPNSVRPVLVSPSLRDILRDYLYFRHVFRHAYTFELEWEKMAGLVKDCEKTLRQLEIELNVFFQSFESQNAS